MTLLGRRGIRLEKESMAHPSPSLVCISSYILLYSMCVQFTRSQPPKSSHTYIDIHSRHKLTYKITFKHFYYRQQQQQKNRQTSKTKSIYTFDIQGIFDLIFLSAGLKKKAYCVRCVRTPVLFFLRSYGDTCIICIHLCIGASIEDTYISYVTPAAVRRLRVIREENKGPDRHGGKIEKPLQKE